MKNNSICTKNISGRTMVKYPSSKSDPICKWRTASPETVIELVSWMPKHSMSKQMFRDYMRNEHDFDFFHTAYQLAAQLGLYYEDNDIFIPRFDHDIDKSEALIYLSKWVKRYYVPNPFTKRGFLYVEPPIHLLYAFADYLTNYPSKNNLATAGAALFGGEMGNLGSVKYFLNEFSNLISVDANNDMSLIRECVIPEIEVDVDRNDKKAFFEHFK